MPLHILPSRCASGVRTALQALAEIQLGVARRSQLVEVGLSPHTTDAMLDGGRWQARGAVVVVMHNGPLSVEQQRWAAVLNAPWPVALAARTAASDRGLVGWDASCTEIVVPRGGRRA